MKRQAQEQPAEAPALTHFRCWALHCWLSIAECARNRAAWHGRKALAGATKERKDFTSRAAKGASRQFACRDCHQAPGVDSLADPTLTTAEAVLSGGTPAVPAEPWFPCQKARETQGAEPNRGGQIPNVYRRRHV